MLHQFSKESKDLQETLITYIPPQDPRSVRGLKMYYVNGVEMVQEDFGRSWGVRFIGAKGHIDISRSYLETTPSTILSPNGEDTSEMFKDQGNHYQDWIPAIKSRN